MKKRRISTFGWKSYVVLAVFGSVVVAALIVLSAQSGVINRFFDNLPFVSLNNGSKSKIESRLESRTKTTSLTQENSGQSDIQRQEIPTSDVIINNVGTNLSQDASNDTHLTEDVGLLNSKTANPTESRRMVEEEELILDDAISQVEVDNASNNATLDDETNPTELGNLSISGRILTLAGEPIPGISIVGRKLGSAQQLVDPSQLKAQSSETGEYSMTGLVPGDYRVNTIATANYPSAVIIVQAGLRSADIVLTGGREFRIYGSVTDERGMPLSNVDVTLSGGSQNQVRSNDSGAYELKISAQPNRFYSVFYRLSNYDESKVDLLAKDMEGVNEKQIDVNLIAKGNVINLAGVVKNEFAEPVVGASVWLTSTHQKSPHTVTSDANGRFSIANVKEGSDYSLVVMSGRQYVRYEQKQMVITSDISPLEITVKTLNRGRISGSMLDVTGNPISNMTLAVHSKKSSSRQTTGDDLGYFEIADAPDGEITFMTRSNPYLRVSGFVLPPGSDMNVSLILDWGDGTISGQVTDGNGNALAGAQVSLSWSHQYSGLKSTSSRHVISDNAGEYHFSQLGPGIHTITASANGYRRAKQDYNVGTDFGDIVVRLESK